MTLRWTFVIWIFWAGIASASQMVEALLAQAGLDGKASVVLMDVQTGKMVEAVSPRKSLPPASVAKAVTVPYALNALGSGFRFQTRVIATGPVQNGRVQGDLILQGGGDPLLDTDGLFKMAEALKAQGIKGITGDFLYSDGAISNVAYVDNEQPEWVGYNPALSGLNLNFNRVFFQWKDGALSLTAKSDNHAPAVSGVAIALTDKADPVFKYGTSKGREVWTIARPALQKNGSRWLPVRDPGKYAAEVFQTLAKDNGVQLPTPKRSNGSIEGTVLASQSGADLVALGRGMLKFSTNLSAEIVGMRASAALGRAPSDHTQSAKRMTDWAKTEYGVNGISFRDHSGLSDTSKATSKALATIMRAEARKGLYPALLKDIPIEATDAITVRAKTGSLNFVSTLAGVIEGPNGQYAFSIMMADEARRAAAKRAGDERPAGARTWIKSARNVQKEILAYWAGVYLE
ncbi:MAG: D-alanyl-D-alanine carboxypeptidase/D-alanyl-D-alanine-endopeptidase [Pseudomonadota bacterium]